MLLDLNGFSFLVAPDVPLTASATMRQLLIVSLLLATSFVGDAQGEHAAARHRLLFQGSRPAGALFCSSAV